MKHRKTKRKISNRQATTIIISVLCAAALLIGLLVVIGPILGGNNGGHYEGDGHNHGSSNLGDGHYEGDGHDHSSNATNSNSNTNANAKVKYQIYTNADKSYRVVFRDTAGKTVAEFNNIKAKNSFLPAKAIDNNPDVYELGWATGQGASEFECIYYNVKTGQVSDKLVAPRGTDGVRVAYASADQKKVIVQDLFGEGYHKEYTLADAFTGEGDIVVGGALQKDNKTVTVSYKGTDGKVRHQRVNLYE